MYNQRDIIEYNVMLNDGKLLPVRGLIISSDDKNMFEVTICRISGEMSVFNPLYHFPLTDEMVLCSLDTPCYITTGWEHIEVWPTDRITRRVNSLNEQDFEKFLVWMTGQVGHKFLRWVDP